jgi:hypothetical protein
MTRPSRRHLGAWLGAVGLLVAACGGSAWAQQASPTPILVKAKVESASLIRAWGQSESQAIAEGLARAVAEVLAVEFRHWAFGATLDRSYAALELRVVENARHKINIALDKVLSDGQRRTLWQEVWLKPTDFALGRRPPRNQAEDQLEARFTELFDESRRQLVRNWLRSVPIGALGTWSGGNQIETLRIVTSLPWKRFAALERSRLKISCSRQGNNIDVTTRGTDQPQPFHHPRLNSTYDALVLKPEKVFERELSPSDLDDLMGSDVRLIYLIEELEPVDDEFFSLG